MSTLLYIPRSSLTREDIESLVKVCFSEDTHRVDIHGGRKIAIKYLLILHSMKFDLSSYIDENQFKYLEEQFHYLKQYDFFKREFDKNSDPRFEPYWELKFHSPKIHQLAINNRQLTNQRSFSPEQLKVYFNKFQIRNIPNSQSTFYSSGFVDNDLRQYMMKYPVQQRQNKGQINTKQARIEQAIFDIPSGNQIIVLDFADERMPGGLFLYGASTQEETICYNSDTYRALLDLKYNRFDGGFMIPEFGCLYIKHVKFFKPQYYHEHRNIDVVAAACYDLTGQQGLYQLPHSHHDIQNNTRKKFETVIAAAQANTEGEGRNTYLLLGPIGCGAFQNDLRTIAQLWVDVLCKPLNAQLNTEQRHAFQHIWFLSDTDDKLEIFEQAFHLSIHHRLQ